MGACASSPNVKKDGSNNKADAGRSEGSDRGQANGDESAAGHPDFGLKDSHELIKFLGRGGTGDTWLFREKATGDAVAIKLIKRPIPKVVMPNILREIRVSQAYDHFYTSLVGAFEYRGGACYYQHAVHSSIHVMRLLQAHGPPQQPTSKHKASCLGRDLSCACNVPQQAAVLRPALLAPAV